MTTRRRSRTTRERTRWQRQSRPRPRRWQRQWKKRLVRPGTRSRTPWGGGWDWVEIGMRVMYKVVYMVAYMVVSAAKTKGRHREKVWGGRSAWLGLAHHAVTEA